MVPKTYRFVKGLPQALRNIRFDIEKLRSSADNISADLQKLTIEVESQGIAINNLSQKQADALNAIKTASAPVSRSPNKVELQADNPALDSYYLAFEDKFRGSEEDIYERLKNSYSKILKAVPKNTAKLPIVDIGCGRGEFLRLYNELGFNSIGVDLNEAMIRKCNANGFKAKKVDGIKYLRESPSKSLAGISGVHLAEHIPFGDLVELVTEAYRTLAPGGFLLLETPNPENLSVGAFSFWYDSSHLKPIPPDVLAFLVEYVGFVDVKVLRMHPDTKGPKDLRSTGMKSMAEKIYGPRDYAVVAFKFAQKKKSNPARST